jgi:carboxylesterase type B
MNKGFANDLGSKVLLNLGCATNDIHCARSKMASEIITALETAIASMLQQPEYNYIEFLLRPLVDGDLIQADLDQLIAKGLHNTKANVMMGSTRDEIAIQIGSRIPNPVPIAKSPSYMVYMGRDKDRMNKLMTSPFYRFDPSDHDTVRSMFSLAKTDFYATCPIHSIARQLAQTNPRVYVYQMENSGVQFPSGAGEPTVLFCEKRACHASDIIPSFGSLDVVKGNPLKQTGDLARIARLMIDRFSTFAKTNDPNPSSANGGEHGAAWRNPDVAAVHWTPFSKSGGEDDPVLGLDLPTNSLGVIKNRDRCEWIEKNMKFEYQLHGTPIET